MTGVSERKAEALRAILRAPEIVQDLYREGKIDQGTAAKLGPKKPTPEQAARVQMLRNATFGKHGLQQPYGSLEAMLLAEIGKGLQEATEEVKTRQEKAQETARENKEPLLPVGANQHTETAPDEKEKHQEQNYGTSASYRVKRLRRDHPDAAKRLEEGEFKSVAAAERWARGEDPHPPRKIPTPLELLQRAWAKASKVEKDQFIDWINVAGW